MDTTPPPIKRIAYQGVPGSFSSIAAKALFGPLFLPYQSSRFREIFEALASGEADIGVVPLENALAGTVQENYDLLAEFPFSIVGEYYCPVQLHLLGIPHKGLVAEEIAPFSLSSVRQVVSHPKALEQCSSFLEQHRHMEQVVFSDTAGAAQMVAERGDRRVVAIASQEAAELYHLEITERSIQNHKTNMTRFVALAKNPTELRSQAEHRAIKCSMIFSLQHKPGSLYHLLGKIAELGFNVTKIESRPIAGRPFEYTFYVDIESSVASIDDFEKGTEALKDKASSLRVLGIYPAASWGV